MKLIWYLVALVLFPMPLVAETYTWVDKHGTVNFTDDYSSIPRKYRNKVNRRDDMSSPQSLQIPGEKKSETGSRSTKEAGPEKPVLNDATSAWQLFGGKKAAEWQREFRDRNAELERLDAKVKELAEIRKKAQVSGPEQVNLYKRHRDTVEQYNESVKRYNELNDTANKVGLPAEYRK